MYRGAILRRLTLLRFPASWRQWHRLPWRQATALALKEHSADAMAAAYARRAAATDSDASYLAYNPAALAGVADTDFSVRRLVGDPAGIQRLSYGTLRDDVGRHAT